jgi:hypothetical protein
MLNFLQDSVGVVVPKTRSSMILDDSAAVGPRPVERRNQLAVSTGMASKK